MFVETDGRGPEAMFHPRSPSDRTACSCPNFSLVWVGLVGGEVSSGRIPSREGFNVRNKKEKKEEVSMEEDKKKKLVQ